MLQHKTSSLNTISRNISMDDLEADLDLGDVFTVNQSPSYLLIHLREIVMLGLHTAHD